MSDLLELVRTTQGQRRPCAVSEFTDLGRPSHICCAAGPAHGPSPPPKHATTMPVPDGHLNLTKVVKLQHPKTVQCSQCGERDTAQELVRTWALSNCGDAVRDSCLSGNTRLDGFPLDMRILVGEPPRHADPGRPAWDADNAVARAKLMLIGIDLQEHMPGHVRGCFEATTSGGTRPSCRFALPALSCAVAALLLNGRVLCSCVGECTDPAHLTVTAEFTVNDAVTVELRVERAEGCERTNSHDVVELAVFRHNGERTLT